MPMGQFHEEQSEFYITTIGNHDIILGTDWLKAHNPEVDWKTSKLRFTRCPSTCKLSAKEIITHPIRRRNIPTHISTIDPGPHYDHEAILARIAVHPFITQQQLLKYHEPIRIQAKSMHSTSLATQEKNTGMQHIPSVTSGQLVSCSTYS